MGSIRFPMKALCCIVCVFCVSGSAVTAAGRSEKREIIGRVKIYGSEPHTYAGIESTDGTIYAIYPPETELALRKLQGRVIRFKVKVLEKGQGHEPLGFGSLMLPGPTVTPLSWKVLKRGEQR